MHLERLELIWGVSSCTLEFIWDLSLITCSCKCHLDFLREINIQFWLSTFLLLIKLHSFISLFRKYYVLSNLDNFLYLELPPLTPIYAHPISWGYRVRQLHLCREVKKIKIKKFPMRLPVGSRWQLVMLEDGILVAEQSLTWQSKRSHWV